MSELFNCHNINDFRKLAKSKLPFPVFHYIDGGADDEVTLKRNVKSFEQCDLVPNVLEELKIWVIYKNFGKKLICLFLITYCIQRLFHYKGEMAVGQAAESFNTFFGISSLSTVSAEEISKLKGPKIFQLYYHKDKDLTKNMIDECKEKRFDALALTVDTITGGNRERFENWIYITTKFNLKIILSYMTSPSWTLNYLLKNSIFLSLVIMLERIKYSCFSE